MAGLAWLVLAWLSVSLLALGPPGSTRRRSVSLVAHQRLASNASRAERAANSEPRAARYQAGRGARWKRRPGGEARKPSGSMDKGAGPRNQSDKPQATSGAAAAPSPSLTAIPCRMHRISFDLRSEAAQGPVSTGVGDCPGRPQGAVSFLFVVRSWVARAAHHSARARRQLAAWLGRARQSLAEPNKANRKPTQTQWLSAG